MRSAIEVIDIWKYYGEFAAVKGISFRVDRGDCYGLLGPKGSGKTTVFKMIYGGADISKGEIYVLENNVKKNIRDIKSKIGLVPQENALEQDFSVLENLLVFGDYFQMPSNKIRNRSQELLSVFQLEEFAEKKVDELSGELKRRLVLARALLPSPGLICLDEPTVGLDPQARNWLWEELRSLKKSGATLFLTTKYMEEAEHLCDSLSIIDKGGIVAQGTPKFLIGDLVGSDVMEAEMEPIEIERFVKKNEQKYEFQISKNKLRLFLRLDQNPKKVFDEIKSNSIVIRRATLNDVFLKIVGLELND